MLESLESKLGKKALNLFLNPYIESILKMDFLLFIHLSKVAWPRYDLEPRDCLP